MKLLFLVVSLVSLVWPQTAIPWKDPSPHTTRLVTVDKDVRLEVLDWGGGGRAIVLLAGGGNTAHVFDEFAPKLTTDHHVYGITRRGFGASGFSASGFGADRLGDDVLAVIDALHLDRPILVGHSIAGEELSSIGTRYPQRVAGLVYLDAAYPYAFDNGKVPSFKEFMRLQGPQPPPPAGPDLATFQALQRYFERVDGLRYPESELRQTWESTPDGRVGKRHDSPGSSVLLTGMKQYAAIPAPALAIFANPHSQGAWVDNSTDPAIQQAAKAYSSALAILAEQQSKAFQTGVPKARVIVIPHAHHYVFLSNEQEVLREMRVFLNSLR